MGAGTLRISDWGTNKKVWKPLALVSLVIFVCFTVFAIFYYRNMNQKISSITAKNVVDNVTLNDYTTKINNANLQNLEKVFNSTFTKEQLKTIAAKNYTYILTINGNIQGKSNEAYINSSTLTVGLSETIAENKLPKSILDLGRISIDTSKGDDISTNITISAGDKQAIKTKKADDSKGISNYYFTLNNLKVGDIVTLFFSDELVNRLGLPNNYVEVFYNK